MDTLWLEHYCHPDCEPLKNIMRLSQEEAFALAKQLADAHPETTAFYRFSDFSNYYPLRLKTDALLHEMLLAMGGQPKQKHPLSFVLGSCDYLHEWFGSGTVLRIPLSAVAPESVSFTFGDSMSTLSRDGSLTMLTMPMLAEAVRQHPGGGQGWLKDALRTCRYIEVQLWDDLEQPVLG